MVHIKTNTDKTWKRGLPLFYPVEADLERTNDLLASMVSMAKTRAKIALIRKMSDITSSAAANLLATLTAYTATDPANGQTINLETATIWQHHQREQERRVTEMP